MLLTTQQTNLPARAFVARHAEVFAVFDERTQDSGNVSYGVRQGDERFFVIESADGPLLAYTWADGELVGTAASRRSDPASSYARFRALPTGEGAAALDAVFRLHVKLARQGFIANDFYDGCLIYDFVSRRIHVVDLDNYRNAPFTNTMGRMFGSTRFMAPEEHELGARIDERTTVFAMGRSIQELFPAPATVSQPWRRAPASPTPIAVFRA